MQRGRRDDRTLLARLRARSPWPFRHREQPKLDAGLLILRIAVGITFVAHGIDKLVDLSSATEFFDALGLPLAGWLAPLVGVAETSGGVLLIVGLATPLAGLALGGDMLVAFLTAHAEHGFFVTDGGGEFVLLLGAACIALAATGAGRISLDRCTAARNARG